MAEDLNLDINQENVSSIGDELKMSLQDENMVFMQDNTVPNPLVKSQPAAMDFQGTPEKPALSEPPPQGKSSLKDLMNSTINSTIQDEYITQNIPKPGEITLPGPKTRYAGKEVDMFKYQEDFDPFGFNPFDKDNAKYYADKETWGSALGKGFDSFGTRFANTWTDSFASYGRMASALVNWDWKKMMPDEGTMIEQNWAEHIESMKNYVFVPPEQEEDLFSKRTVSEFIGNTGFALGTFGALATELVADAAITYATGGAGSGTFAATLSRFGLKEGVKEGAKLGVKESLKKGAIKFADFLGDVNKGATRYANESAESIAASAKVSNKINQAEDLANAGKIGSNTFSEGMKEVFDIYSLNLRGIVKSKSFEELGMNIAKGAPLLGTAMRYGEKIAAGSKAGLSTGKLVGIGLAGTRRLVQEVNMSSTEAGFEAVSTYGQSLDLMVENYRKQHNGENPTPEEFVKMQSKAMDASTANYKTNMGLLLVTNRLQFGGLFNKWISSTKLTKEILEEGAENLLGVNRIGKRAAGELLGKSYKLNTFHAMFPVLGRLGIYKKIATDFGKKQAFYEFGKSLAKNGLKMEVTEGLQENLQEMSAEAWKNYYVGQYNGIKYTLSEAFDKALDSQFTKQGFRTFLQGALTGGMIRPVTVGISRAINTINEKTSARQYKDNPAEDPYVRIKQQFENDVNLQNDLLARLSKMEQIEDKFINFATQVDATTGQTAAASSGLQFEWHNKNDQSVLAGVLAATRTGTSSMYIQAIKDLGKTMTIEEFEKSFGVKFSDTKYNSVEEVMDKAAKDVKKYTDVVEGVRKSLKEIPDPLLYEANSADRIYSTMLHNAREEAIRIVAANALQATRKTERIINLTNEITAIPGMASSSEFALRVAANPANFRGEIGNYLADIKVLQESLSVVDPSQKPDILEKIKDKKKMVDLIETWMNFWTRREFLEMTPEELAKQKIDRRDILFDTFIGKVDYVEQRNQDDKVVNPKKEIYILDHESVIETFREMVNLRNKEAGITQQISEKDLRAGIDKIIDYIRLDQEAKDYMEKMDVLYNPEYYNKTIRRILDGRFKYNLLEYVDDLQGRINQIILATVAVSDIKSPQERIILAHKLSEEITKIIKESDAYKNLTVVSLDKNLGISQMEFVDEQAKKLDELVQDKFAEILNTYSPKAVDDLEQAEYDKYKATGEVSYLNLSIIARKQIQGNSLGVHQQEIVDSKKYEKEIDNIKSRIKVVSENKKSNLQDVNLSQEVIKRLVDRKLATEEELANLSISQIIDLGLQKGLITAEDVARNMQSYEPIPEDVWKKYKDGKTLPEDIIYAIAEKDFYDKELSVYEKRILDEGRFTDKILKIQDDLEEIEKAKEADENARAVDNEQNVVKNAETSTGATTAEVVTAGPNATTVIQDSENASDNAEVVDEDDFVSDDMDDFAEQVRRLNSKKATNDQKLNIGPDAGKSNQQTEPFAVTGSPESGFNVRAKNGTILNGSTPIQSQKEAEELAASASITFENTEYIRERISQKTNDDIKNITQSIVDEAYQMIQSKFSQYNSGIEKEEEKLKTFKDYALTKEGANVVSIAVTAVVENRTYQDVENTTTKKQRNESLGATSTETASQENKFEGLTPVGTGPAIATVSLIENLHAEIMQIQSTDQKMNDEIMQELSVVQDQLLFTGAREATPEELEQERAIVNNIKQKYGKEISEKNRKFVGEVPLTVDDIIKQINELNTCI